MKRGFSIDEHINNYTNLLTNLVNVDIKIDKEDETVILLSFFPDKEYEIFTLTLINGRQTFKYSEVSAALVNYEARRQDRQSSSGSTSAEVLAVRGGSSNRKGKGDRARLKFRSCFRDLKKNQCTFYKEIGHWKVDCPRIKDKSKKKKSKTEANLALVVSTQGNTSQADGSDSDSSVFSFSITTPIVGYSGDAE